MDECLDIDDVECVDEDVLSCLDEVVLECLDNNNNDEFYIDFLHEHPLE